MINDIYLQCRHHRDQAYALASSTSRGRVYGEALRQLMAVNPEGALLMEFARGREDNVAVALQTRALRSAGVCIRGLSDQPSHSCVSAKGTLIDPASFEPVVETTEDQHQFRMNYQVLWHSLRVEIHLLGQQEVCVKQIKC